MKAQFGAIVTDGRGKIGGQVMSKNKSGSYLRTKVTPVNRQTSAQQASRSRLASISQAWRGLTVAQRTAWNNAVGDYARTDIFGNLRNPSGFTLFQRLNNNLSAIGVALLSSPPVLRPVATVASADMAYITNYPAFEFATVDNVPATSAAVFLASPPMSQGISPSINLCSVIKVRPAGSGYSYDMTTDYSAKFGVVSSAGLLIAGYIKFIDIETGLSVSNPLKSCISYVDE